MGQSAATSERWSVAAVPDQHGRTVVITGASSGIGFEAARVLADRGALVVLACRSEAKSEAAVQRIRAAVPGASLESVRLDLASLDSVRTAAAEVHRRFPRLDLLINNAGVMTPPYSRTADGFELQFGTNHLGHFAFTGLLLDRIRDVPGARIVTVASAAHRMGTMNFDDLNSERGYRRSRAYGQSKLANLLFTYELQRRLAAAGAQVIAVSAHPGASRTELDRHMPGWLRSTYHAVGGLITQDAVGGSLPTLRAATDPAVTGGQYYGPSGFAELRGHPVIVRSGPRSYDVRSQARLWEESQRLTGVTYPI
jgi:NAD(P)-dependent dehydrogenase (short-subunit alcohol dehydrogenase family)